MLMSTLVILRFTGIFAAYTGITVLLPEIMFRRILKGRRLSEQFLMSYTFGNFYIINIVFALQLLHISNFFTLTAVTVLMSILIGVKAFLPTKIIVTLPFEIAIFLKRTYYNLCFAVIIQFSRYVLVMSLKARSPGTSIFITWWAKMDSNHRPHDYQSCALAS